MYQLYYKADLGRDEVCLTIASLMGLIKNKHLVVVVVVVVAVVVCVFLPCTFIYCYIALRNITILHIILCAPSVSF